MTKIFQIDQNVTFDLRLGGLRSGVVKGVTKTGRYRVQDEDGKVHTCHPRTLEAK